MEPSSVSRVGVEMSDQKPSFSFEPLLACEDEEFRRHFPKYVGGLSQCKQNGLITFPDFAQHAEVFYRFQPRCDDVWVMTFPKSGTTWMQEIVWLIMNNCDFEGAKIPLNNRSPFLEACHFIPASLQTIYEKEAIVRKTKLPMVSTVMDVLNYWNITPLIRPVVKRVIDVLFSSQLRDVDEIANMPSPRVIKCHLPFYMLNPQLLDTSKVVYVARNPKDVIVSYFHYHRLMDFHQFTGDVEQFAEYFMRDEVHSSPYFPHLLQAWNQRHHPNMLFVFYEDLKRNLRGELEKIAKFLGKYLSEGQLTQMVKHLRIDSFTKNEAVNNEFCKELGFMNPEGRFIRKGKTGDWKNHFGPEINRRIDQWMEKNLAGTELSFITELDQQD